MHLAIALSMFLLGVVLGNLRFPSYKGTSNESQVAVDLYFLIRNPDLIGSRRFITSAKIVPASARSRSRHPFLWRIT
jgi:hypothetical protein